MKHKNRRHTIKIFMLCTIFGFLAEKTIQVHASGNINDNEAAVLGALEGEFTYDGNVYVVDSSYKEAMYAYFIEDGVDLTASQKDECINGIAGNVGQAVSEGYLVKVRTLSEEEKTASSSKKKQNQKKKDNKKNATTKPKEFTEEEKKQLKEKWQTEIDDIEEKAEKIKNGETIVEETPASTAANIMANGDSPTEQDKSASSKENNQETENSNQTENNNQTENKIQEQKQNLAYKIEHGTGHIFKIVLGLVVVTAIFYAGFRIWRRKPVLKEQNYTDIHTHILPGVDDGAKDMETTISMLHLAEQQGIHTIIATPHYKVGQHKVTAEQLQKIQKQVQQEIEKEGMDIELLLGNELYYSKDICKRLEEKKALTLAGTRYVLVEFSPSETYTELYHGLRELIQEGYIPILAHMERYQCLHKKKKRDKIEELIKLGVYMQMNIQSLHTRYCKKLVKDGCIHFFGSDSHNTKNRPPKMQEGLVELGNLVTKVQMEKIMIENPKMLREDKYIR